MFAGIVVAGLGVIFMVFVWGLAALAFVFWIWMLVHAITNKGLTDVEKIVWVLVVLFLHFLDALIYFFVGRPKGRGAITI